MNENLPPLDSDEIAAHNARAERGEMGARDTARLFAAFHRTLVEEGKVQPQWAGRLTEHYMHFVLPSKR